MATTPLRWSQQRIRTSSINTSGARKMTHLGLLLTLLTISNALANTGGGRLKASSRQGGNILDRVLEDTEEEGEAENNPTQKNVVDYSLWKPAEFSKTLERWKNQYKDLIRVTTAQEKYNLKAAGGEKDCPFWDIGPGCPNYIFTIQDYVAHPEGSESSNSLPEVFWSGCLHGNERVGPTSTMEAATLLLEAAYCEGLPRSKDEDLVADSEGNYGTWEEQLGMAKQCRTDLKDKGVDDVHRKWLARLVTTRRIVVVPTANALGYFQDRRTEGMIDPNRDFPYDVVDPKICMQTIAGRALNEIYRDHMFQLALTFHAGMEVVAYEWGAPTWLNHFSPDDEAQKQVAAAYSNYGGGWKKSHNYQYGTMNDLVYYVRGGMEDWAYAGSWDPDRVIPCEPSTYDGYPKEKTIYNNSTLRVFNMLIETSDDKEPKRQDLGTSLDVLNGKTVGNGHVSRNIRLALLAAENVEPYVSIVGVDNLILSDDVTPLSKRDGRSCEKTKGVMVAKNADEVEVQFTVGGSMAIDNIELWYAKWDDIPEDQLDCLNQPLIMDSFTKGTIVGASAGTGFFSQSGASPRPDEDSDLAKATKGPVFTGKIAIPNDMTVLDRLVVIASARVDQAWKNKASNTQPDMDPQSHIVNVRTNPDWSHESAGKKIRGRLDWYSFPLTIVKGDFIDSAGKQGSHSVRTIEMHPRFGDTDSSKGGVKPKSAGQEQLWVPVGMWEVLAAVAGALALCLCFSCMCRSCCGRGRASASHLKSSNHDDFVFDSQPYSDRHEEYGETESDDGVELPRLS